MKSQFFKLVGFAYFFFLCVYSHAEKILVHPDEKPYLESIINRLNIDKSNLIISNFYKDERYRTNSDFYKNYGDFKNHYFYKNEPYQTISFKTNKQNRIVYFNVLRADLSDINEIENFKELRYLDLHGTKVASLNGISKLKKLKKLGFVGNDNIASLSEIKDLPLLEVIDAGASVSIIDISKMDNLPRLREFICYSCKLSDIRPLSGFGNLEVLNIGVEVQSLDPIKRLNKLIELRINSRTVKYAGAIGQLENLRYLDITGTQIQNLTLNKTLTNLELIRLSDVPLDVMPDLSKTPNIKSVTVLGSNINLKVLDLGYLPHVERLNFSNIKFTELRNLDNYPNLKELSLYDAQLTTLEPLLDVPNLSILNLNQSSKDIPNASAVISALIKANTSFTSRKRDKKTAREVYEQILATKPEPVSNSGRRRRN